MDLGQLEAAVPDGLVSVPDLLSQPHCVADQDGVVSRGNGAWDELFPVDPSDGDQSGLSLAECIRVMTVTQIEDVWTLSRAIGFMAFPCVLVCGPMAGENCQILVIPGETEGGLVVVFPLGGLNSIEPAELRDPPGVAHWGQEESAALDSRLGSDCLTAREVQIVGLLAKGFSGPKVAAHLSIAESTVQAHVQNAMRKTGSATRTSLVATAMSDGVIKV